MWLVGWREMHWGECECMFFGCIGCIGGIWEGLLVVDVVVVVVVDWIVGSGAYSYGI